MSVLDVTRLESSVTALDTNGSSPHGQCVYHTDRWQADTDSEDDTTSDEQKAKGLSAHREAIRDGFGDDTATDTDDSEDGPVTATDPSDDAVTPGDTVVVLPTCDDTDRIGDTGQVRWTDDDADTAFVQFPYDTAVIGQSHLAVEGANV